MINEKRYLGDSVYARFDGFNVTLTTENGDQASNTIILEPQTGQAFGQFLTDMNRILDEELVAADVAAKACEAIPAGDDKDERAT